MSKTDVLKTGLCIALGLVVAVSGAVRSAAADRTGAPTGVDAGDQDSNSPQQRTLSPGPFNGDWSVTTGDGTIVAINIHQFTGGLRNTVTGTVTPRALTIVRGFAANKTSLHLTISAAGQKGDIVLTLAPNGKSFTGTGQLADGTAITWIGRQASSGLVGAQPPQTRQAYARSRQTRQTLAQQTDATDDTSQQTQQADASSQQIEPNDDTSSPQTQEASASQQADPTDDMSSAANPPADAPPPRPARSPPQRSQSSDSFHGNWNVSAGDGTTFAINFRQSKSSLGKKILHEITGGAQNNVVGTVTPAVLKIVNGSVTNKIYLHLTVSMSGQKGDVMLTLAPDGNSFTGAGRLADGTAITWSGQRASSGAQNRATDTSRIRNKIDRLRREISPTQDNQTASSATPGK